MKVIGIDIGGSSIKAGIVCIEKGLFKKVYSEENLPLRTNEFIEIKEKVIEICNKKLSEGADRFVGISTAGSVDNTGTVISAGNFNNYRNVSWKEIITKEFGKMSVSTINDGRASAWGEYSVSNPKAKTHIHAVIGTGIGGGVIHNGELLQGDSGQAGYIGHIKITADKTPLCSCGKMGCVETLASAKGILAKYNDLVYYKYNTFNELIDNFNMDKNRIINVFEESGYWLGVALGNVMNVLNPQCVTVGGGVILATLHCTNKYSLENNPYMNGVERGIHYATHRRVEATGSVICGVLGNNAGIIGAANLVVASK